MKKSVFELDRSEGKKVDKELRKTSYYKQHLLIYMLEICVFAFFFGGTIGYISANESLDSNMLEIAIAIIFVIAIGFVAFMGLTFGLKRMELVKKYYEEIYTKKHD